MRPFRRRRGPGRYRSRLGAGCLPVRMAQRARLTHDRVAVTR